MRIAPLLVLMLAAACGRQASTPAPAAGCANGGSVVVSDAWVRTQPDASAMSAAYATICNGRDAPVSLAAVSTPAAGMVEAHETASGDNGKMVMRGMGGLSIGPGETVKFEPGGKHLMVMDLRGPIAPGDQIAFEFRFDDGETVQVEAVAKSPAEAARDGR